MHYKPDYLIRLFAIIKITLLPNELIYEDGDGMTIIMLEFAVVSVFTLILVYSRNEHTIDVEWKLDIIVQFYLSKY